MNEQAKARIEYRVHYKREACDPKSKVFRSRQGAERRMVLLGPEPWKAYTKKGAEEFWCCPGYECGCEGLTVSEEAMRRREGLPPLEWVRIETRTVVETPWAIPADEEEK